MPLELRFATKCVGLASQLATRAEEIGSVLSAINNKGTTVTSVDYAVQAWVGARIETQFPNDHFVSKEETNLLHSFPDLLTRSTEHVHPLLPDATEEKVLSWVARGEGEPAGDRFWILDPITPTRSLLDGGVYSIQLAGVWDGQVQVAAIACPWSLRATPSSTMFTSGLLLIAKRGWGSWWTIMDEVTETRRLGVSSRSLKEAIRLWANPPNELDADLHYREAVSREIGSPYRKSCSSALRYAMIAAGDADLLIHLPLIRRSRTKAYTWRHAAGSLMVEEAGGRISDLDGRPLDFTAGRVLTRNRGLMVSNGLIHEEALAAVRRATKSI